MVSAVSGPGAVRGETDGLGGDEDGFASILASLVATSTPQSSGAVAASSVPGRGTSPEPDVVAESEPDAGAAGVEADRQGAPRPDTIPLSTRVPADGAPIDSGDGVGSQSTSAGPTLGSDGPEPPDSHDQRQAVSVTGARSDSSLEAPIAAAVEQAVTGDIASDRVHAGAPAASPATTPVGAPIPSQTGSGDLSADHGEVVDSGSPGIGSEPAPEGHAGEISPGVEESIGSDGADDSNPPPGIAPPIDHAEDGAPTDLVSVSGTGADTEARVESIREVVEWLEGIGLESTPGEMRIEIPDGEVELIVRVTVVDGLLEIEAAGADGTVPEGWLEDLRRELDARGFDFAGRRQSPPDPPGRGDRSGAAPESNPTRRATPRPGVLL